jgi:hypothetical protein
MSDGRRFVFDTNTLISAVLIKNSLPRQAFDLALEKGSLCISAATLAELQSILGRTKFDKYISPDERVAFITAFIAVANWVEVAHKVEICRDPKDNKFLELALSAGAEMIITGDDDLRVLDPFQGIRILTPRQCVEEESSR